MRLKNRGMAEFRRWKWKVGVQDEYRRMLVWEKEERVGEDGEAGIIEDNDCGRD